MARSVLSGRLFFRAWLAFLGVLFVVFGGGLAWQQRAARHDDRESWRALMDPTAADPGGTASPAGDPGAALPVHVGIYVERIEKLSLRDSQWRVALDVWFAWQGEALDLAERLVAVDGSIVSLEKLAEEHVGDNHYERYAAVIEMTKVFRIAHFPLDRHLLVVALESGSHRRSELVFVPDTAASAVSSRADLPGFRVGEFRGIEKAHAYKTARGEPGLVAGERTTFSQARFCLLIEREGFGLFLKMFQALFVAVAIALLACFIRPTDVDPRFGLGVGALFAAVANSYLIGGYVPETNEFALADTVNLLGIVTILLTLVESTASLHVWQGLEDPGGSRRLDRVSFALMLGGYIAANALILWGAAA